MSYFPLVLCVISWLKCILQQKFGKLNLWIRISFIILFMIDLYKDNHVRAFVNFFFKKKKKLLLRNYWLDFYQISRECSLDTV